MSNDSLRGHIDRRVPQPPVVNKVLQTFNEYKFSGGELEMRQIEQEAFSAALMDLEDDDKLYILEQIEKLSGNQLKVKGCQMKIKNLGEKGVLEALAKVAIFCNANAVNAFRSAEGEF